MMPLSNRVRNNTKTAQTSRSECCYVPERDSIVTRCRKQVIDAVWPPSNNARDSGTNATCLKGTPTTRSDTCPSCDGKTLVV